MSKVKSGTNHERNFLAVSVSGAIWIAIVQTFWPGTIPFNTFSFWTTNGNLGEWLAAGLPIFAWGFVVQTIFEFMKGQSVDVFGRSFFRALSPISPSFGKLLLGGLILSTWAGFVEEVCFRWLIFLSSIPGIKVVNYLFFGWAGFGVPEWLHNHVAGWFANVTTFGQLHYILLTDWAVGAAILAANAMFRDGHKYQGWFGILNSWFIGMFFFWLLFHFGLWAAISVHFTYDLIVFTILAIGTKARD